MSTWIERLQMLERLDGLIRRKATGDREALARRLGVSVRTVTNLKQELEMLGAEIRFDKCSGSYMYEKEVRFNWRIVDYIGAITGGYTAIHEPMGYDQFGQSG